MRRPDVALDRRVTSHMSLGMQQYARELLARLPRVAPDLSFETFGTGDNFDWDEQVAIPARIVRDRPRLVHFLAPYAPLVVPARYVVTIHDLIDLRYPQFVKPKAHWYYRVALRRIARAARCVITDDERTADDLVAFYAIQRRRIAVIPLGVDLDAVEPIRPPRPYVIYAGNRRPHKDLATLAAGWSRVDAECALDLVVTGDTDVALQEASRERGTVRFLGPMPHGEVMRWIAGASALVHPALHEGFGLPLLEAMRLGTPVVASDSAVPLILREHARMFPAGDAGALARAVEGVLRGEEARRAAAAHAATATLTWDRCARTTAELYRRLLAT